MEKLYEKIRTEMLNQVNEKKKLSWADKDYLWNARASLVPFAQCKSQINYEKEIFEIASKLIKKDERFSKTAVGWVMREWNNQYDSNLVIEFCRENSKFITTEVFNNIFKHFDRNRKKEIKKIIFENI